MNNNFNKEFQVVKSRISNEETQQAINKLVYEINQRKNEFLSLCIKEDVTNASKLHVNVFRKILHQFTIYLSKLEKEMIISKYTINSEYIDYLAISNLIPHYNIQYLDPLLHHLNAMNRKLDNKNIQVNTAKIGKLIDLSPIEKLNCQLNEENFMIKIAKEIMTNLMTKSNIKYTPAHLTFLLKKCDYDNDGKLSIGEISSVLDSQEIFLGEYDLRFFFEYFPRMGGKIPIDTFETYINNSYQKQYEQTSKTEFVTKEAVEAVEKQEMKDEKYYEDIVKSNYIIAVIKECLLIFGQDFLMKYFSKSFEFNNNKFFILDEQLIVGFKLLGYKEPLPSEMGNFKLLCINKRLALMNQEKKIKIDVEQLFNFIIDYFSMTNQIHKCTSDELIQGMSTKYFRLMNETFLNTVTDKINNTDIYQSQINEFEFRKKFIKSFGFIDHDFFDYTIKNIGNYNEEEKKEESYGVKSNVYNLKKVDAKYYIELAYNITFMSMLHNYSNIGLMIDSDDAIVLNEIYRKMEQKLFQQQRIHSKTFNVIETYGKTLPKKVFEANYGELGGNKTALANQIDPKANVKTEFLIGTYKESSIKIQEYSSLDSTIKDNQKPNREIDIGKVIRQKQSETNIDPIEVIPNLFFACRDYLEMKYKLKTVDYSVLFNVGICRLFRDQLISKGVNIKKKTHYTIFLNAISDLFTEEKNKEVKEFICQIVKIQKDTDGILNIQFVFSKIEEILLQYCKVDQLNSNKVNLTN